MKKIIFYLLLSSLVFCNTTLDLFNALKKGNVKAVKTAINNNANVNGNDSQGNKPLDLLVDNIGNISIDDEIEITKLLLSKGANINATKNYKIEKIFQLVSYLRDEFLENGKEFSEDNIKNLNLLKLLIDNNANLNISKIIEYEDGKKRKVSLLEHTYWNSQNINILEFLIENGAKFDNIKNELLTEEASDGKMSIIQLLINNGADVNAITENTATGEPISPLLYAIYGGRKEAVELLIKNGANVNSKIDGKSLLNIACENSNIEIIKLLINNGASIDDYTKLLLIAIDSNDKEMVESFIENGADVDGDISATNTPLLEAIEKENKEIVELLIKNGANINQGNSYDDRPLLTATLKGNKEIVELLIKNEANINQRDKDGNTALLNASISGNIDLVKYLLGLGLDINAVNNNRDNLLTLILKNKFFENEKLIENSNKDIDMVKKYEAITELAIEKGTNINNLNLNKSNPLSYAVAIGSKKIIELMIEKGVIINKVNIDGDTLLFNAIESSSKEIVQMFLEKGLNINAVNNQGVTPLLKAMYINDDEIIKLLINKGAYIDIEDNKGNTPLNIAIKNKNIQIVNFLINNKVNVNYKTLNAVTPLIICDENDSESDFNQKKLIKEIRDTLIKNGAKKISDSNWKYIGNKDWGYVTKISPVELNGHKVGELELKIGGDEGGNLCFIIEKTPNIINDGDTIYFSMDGIFYTKVKFYVNRDSLNDDKKTYEIDPGETNNYEDITSIILDSLNKGHDLHVTISNTNNDLYLVNYPSNQSYKNAFKSF